jgi:hypothetical protein
VESAVRIVRDVLGIPDRAEEIEDESLDIYAERRKIFFLWIEVLLKQALLIDRGRNCLGSWVRWRISVR